MLRCLWLLPLFAAPLFAQSSGKLERGFVSFGPKADAFALGLRPQGMPLAGLKSEPFKRSAAQPFPDTFEVVFFARTKPVRIRVISNVAGKSLKDRYETELKELFRYFDRDGDGCLNRYEVELIFAKSEFQQMLGGSFGFRGQSGEAASLEKLDLDGDGRVSYEEFAEYYSAETTSLVQVRALPQNQSTDPYTPELFAKLDTNGDGKLSEAELKQAEKILMPLDLDEDETVSLSELLAGSVARRFLGEETTAAMMANEMMNGEKPKGPRKLELIAALTVLPGSVVQQALAAYDTDKDFELTAKEIGFDKATFDRLDTNKDGKLSATELDAWRLGEPDVIVTLTLGATEAECKASAVAGKNGHGGVEIPKPTTPDRIVLKFQGQTLDFAAAPLPDYARNGGNPYGYLFPPGRDFLEEKDLVGPQYQFLRVAFEPADADGDGKLTKAEFDRYIGLQTRIMQLGVRLGTSVRTPNLFQLIDTNGDGRLGVKELRTAYDRLLPLEPSGGKDVTKAVLLPSAVIRLAQSAQGGPDQALTTAEANSQYGARVAAPTIGPIWFRKMDRNGDGDVSRLEFLGSKEDFDRIDTNKDGLISLEEAEAFDKLTRPKK